MGRLNVKHAILDITLCQQFVVYIVQKGMYSLIKASLRVMFVQMVSLLSLKARHGHEPDVYCVQQVNIATTITVENVETVNTLLKVRMRVQSALLGNMVRAMEEPTVTTVLCVPKQPVFKQAMENTVTRKV